MHRLLLLCCVLGLTGSVLGCRGQASGKPSEETTEARAEQMTTTVAQQTTTVSPTPPQITTPPPFSNTTPADGPQTDPPRTATPAGVFQGSWMTSRRGRRFQAYRGIKYAEPPVGELRFQPPKPILEYKAEVDASQDGPACPFPGNILYPMDEDCLTINVFTPDNNSTKPLPVIFFIHAGGFYSMTGRSDRAGPHYLLDKDIVLVSINYRLGSLGFLSTGDALAPGNNGFKDQVVALKWVQRNIRAFGGDPNLVTIAGCSAGSTSVMLHMVSPMSKGLFHRGISMSGSPTGKEPLSEDLYDLAVKQARILKCPTNSSTAIISCLKTKSWREMGNSLLAFFDQFGYDPLRLWKPIVERDFGQERFLTIDSMDAIRQGKVNFVPHMISLTTGEFFWKAFTVTKNVTLLKRMNEDWENIAPLAFDLPAGNSSAAAAWLKRTFLRNLPIADDEMSNQRLGRLYGDGITGFHVHRMANLMCHHSPHKVYYSEFAYIGNHSHYEDSNTKKPIAAAHHDDLIYLFSMSYRFPTIGLDTKDSQLVDRMTALWYNFAKTGDPNPVGSEQPELANMTWPAMTPNDRSFLRIADDFTVGRRMFENRFEVWEDIYPIMY